MARFRVRWTTDPQPDKAWESGSKSNTSPSQRDQAAWMLKLARMLKRDKMVLVETDAEGFMVYESKPARTKKATKAVKKTEGQQTWR